MHAAEGSSSEANSKTYVITFPGQLIPPSFLAHGILVSILGGEQLSCEGAVGPCAEESGPSRRSQKAGPAVRSS